jgi:CDP-glucose 4,6-dehydratase
VTGMESLRNRSVLITGHTGFKGSWLTLWLNRLGAHVSGFALDPPTVPSNFATSGIRDLLVRQTDGDVRDPTQVEAAVEACQPDVIFHLAAQTLVRQAYTDARQTFEINVLGTANVLEAVRDLHRPCVVIIVTSDKCYENSDPSRRHRESDPLGGNDPYSASKAAAEIVTHAYQSSFFPPLELLSHGVKVASVRAGNAIGGGDWAIDRIVPDTVRALVANRSLGVRNPDSIRPWQHVLEPLSGYLLLASRMLSSDDSALASGWNFGPNAQDEATVRELVDFFLRVWGNGRWEIASGGKAPKEEELLRLCNDRARTQLGWQPRWCFAESVRRTAEWYRQFYAVPGRSTRDLCLEDILGYESAAPNESSNQQPVLQHSLQR